MAENLLGRPQLVGSMTEDVGYRELATGLTDRVFLIGHADGLELNDPYQVTSIKDAIDAMGRDADSPLLRAMLEAYYSGARDIWLVAAAPMDEWVELLADREDADFYATYYGRLEATYSLLLDWDAPQIVCPLSAPFGVSEDFTTQLANFCAANFEATSSICLGLIGTAVETMDDDAVDTLVSAADSLDLAGAGKFVAVVVGSGVVNLVEMPFAYTTAPLGSMAAVLASQPLDRGLTYARLPNVVTIGFPDLSPVQIENLTNARLNPMVQTTRSRRGFANEIVLATDNTLADLGSDFWSLTQMRLVMVVVEAIQTIGSGYIGTIGFGQFKIDVDTYFLNLMELGLLRGFNVNINRVPFTESKRFSETIMIDVMLRPYFGLRTINFTTTVGPTR